METQLEEESMGKMNLIIIGIVMVVVIAVVADLVFGGRTGFIRNIVCGIIYYLPGGSYVSLYLECNVVPV